VIQVYFTASDGGQFRVYDAAFSGGASEQLPVRDPSATVRLFIPNDHKQRSRTYTFKSPDSRVLGEHTLERQLRESSDVSLERLEE